MVEFGYNEPGTSSETRVGRAYGELSNEQTMGIPPSHKTGLESGYNRTTHSSIEEHESEEITSSSQTPQGGTRADAVVVPEPLVAKATENGYRRGNQNTAAFSEFLFRRKAAEMITLLDKLKPNLQKPDGAVIMTFFRRSLEEIWNVAGNLPREKVIVVSAVEEAVRNTKWRELSIGQVDVLRRVLTDFDGIADLDRAFRAIQRSQVDIYPSAADDFDEEAGTDYEE